MSTLHDWLLTTTGNLLRSVPAGLGLPRPRGTQVNYSTPVLPPNQVNSLHTSYGQPRAHSSLNVVAGSSSAGSVSLSQQIQQRQQLYALSSVCRDGVYWRVAGRWIPRPPHLSNPLSLPMVYDIQQRTLDRAIPTSPIASLSHQIQRRQQLQALTSVCSRLTGSMTHPPVSISMMMLDGIQQRSLDGLVPGTSPLHGIHRPLTVYGMTRKTASTLYGMAWTLSAKLHSMVQAGRDNVIPMLQVLIAKLYRLEQAAAATMVRHWQEILASVAFVCSEAILSHMLWMRITTHNFTDIIPLRAEIVTLPLTIYLIHLYGDAVYQEFVEDLGDLLDENVRPVAAALLTPVSISMCAHILPFPLVYPFGSLLQFMDHILTL